MNCPFKRLWSAIERLPDLAAVPGEWRSLLGSEYELVGRFLLPTQRIALSGKSTAPGRNCVHEFRPWKGEYLSVCPDGCETVTLSRDEVVVHRLDVAALGREIAEAMGLEALPAEAVPELPNVLQIGEYVPLGGHRFPVCLVFTGEPDQLRCDVDGLAARAEPFVLLAPTRSAVTQACADLFKRAKSSFLPLNELLGQGDDGRLALLDGHTADNVLADFRAIHVSQPAAVQAEPGGGAAEVPWSDAPEYLPNSKALKMAEGRLDLKKLSRLLTPSGAIHYMQKGRRCKVHAQDFLRYLKNHPDPESAITDELIDKHLSGIEARKAEIDRKRQAK
jgi:hypothetical protein